jgi:hypothetical protein
MQALLEARAAAVRTGAPSLLTSGEDHRTLRITRGGAVSALPAGGEVTLSGAGCAFMPDGSSNGCTATLSAGGASLRFAVDPTTSRVVEQR